MNNITITIIMLFALQLQNIKCMEKPNNNSLSTSVSTSQILHAAATDSQCLKKILDHNNIAIDHTLSSAGETPVHIAAIYNTDSLQVLLHYHPDINAQNNLGQTPLHYAAKHSKKRTHILLEHGAHAYKIDNNNDTPLAIAAETTSSGALKAFLQYDVNTTSAYLENAIMAALTSRTCNYQFIQGLRLLLTKQELTKDQKSHILTFLQQQPTSTPSQKDIIITYLLHETKDFDISSINNTKIYQYVIYAINAFAQAKKLADADDTEIISFSAETIIALIKNGLPVNMIRLNGTSLIDYAAISGHTNLFGLLLIAHSNITANTILLLIAHNQWDFLKKVIALSAKSSNA